MRLASIALATAAAMVGAPANADDKSSTWIRVQQLSTGGSMAARPGSTLGWIEIQGWDWEVEAKPGGAFKGETTGIEPTSDSRRVKPAGSVGANETMTVGGGRTESPPEKDPLTTHLWGFKIDSTTGGPAAPDKYGRVKVKFAWDGCARGQRLPLVELRDAGTLYRLEDVTVASCGNGVATFNYARLRRLPASSQSR